MGLESHLEAIASAEALDASELAVVLEAEKPLIDWEMAELGRAMKLAQAVKKQADRAVRLLEEEQARRLAELRAAGDRIEKRDAGYAWFVKHPAPAASPHQIKFLRVFELCMERADAALLTDAFNLCQQVDAQHTSWRAQTGEALEVAYARRLKELEAK